MFCSQPFRMLDVLFAGSRCVRCSVRSHMFCSMFCSPQHVLLDVVFAFIHVVQNFPICSWHSMMRAGLDCDAVHCSSLCSMFCSDFLFSSMFCSTSKVNVLFDARKTVEQWTACSCLCSVNKCFVREPIFSNGCSMFGERCSMPFLLIRLLSAL